MFYLQGTFGKVYTAINNETGDIMAMKELPLQPNDHKTLRNVAEELRIFESIRHKHLINHYGVEVGGKKGGLGPLRGCENAFILMFQCFACSCMAAN